MTNHTMMNQRMILDTLLHDVKELVSKYPKEQIEQLLQKLNHTLDFGCFFDPTAWMRHSDQLQREKKILEKFLELCEELP